MRKYIITLLLLPMLASAQYFEVFDIDTSEYPIMKAKFYSIDANGNQILNHSPADFEITENGEPRDVISVSCSFDNSEPVSLVIAIDLSSSIDNESLKLVIEATKSFVDWLPQNGSEIAIIGFNEENRIIKDFTSNKSKLLKYIDNMKTFGGTKFNAAFINPAFSALKIMGNAKFDKRSIMLITDGFADGSQEKIITQSKALNTSINSITLYSPTPIILKKITEQTNGVHFENINEVRGIREIVSSISLNLFIKPCEVIWLSELQCNNLVDVSFKLKNITKRDKYRLSNERLGRLEVSPKSINFGDVDINNTKDTFITVTSYSSDIILNDIIINNNPGNFEIKTQLPIVIKNGTSQRINISFSSTENFRYFSLVNLITDKCTQEFSLYGGNKNHPLKSNTLKIITPNGGEIYGVGIDTLINWKGVLYDDIVSLEYSHDGGTNWYQITTEASKLQHVWTTPNFVSDYYLIRATQGVPSDLKEGEIVWEKSIGNEFFQGAYSIKHTSDGGYIVAGDNTSNFHSTNSYDFCVVKIDADGKVEWDEELISPERDHANSVIESTNGGFVVVGSIGHEKNYIDNDIVVLKLDYKGNTEWEKRYGSNRSDGAYRIVETEDNGFVVVGVIREGTKDVSVNFGREDIWIIKLNNEGSLVWQNTIGGKESDTPSDIIATHDGGYMVAGGSSSNDNGFENNNGGHDSWIFKLDKNGNLQWQKNYGDEHINASTSIIQTIDGGFLLAVNSRVDRLGEIEYCNIYKLDDSGEIEWKIKREDNKSVEDVIETIEGNIIVAGNYKEDYWVMKLNSAGEIVYEKTYGGSDNDFLKSLDNTTDGGYVLAGGSRSTDGDISDNKGIMDMWIVKIAGPPQPLQSDTSDAVFSIIMPEPVIIVTDIDIGQMIVGNTKDSTVLSVICNNGDAPLHVLGVDITGGDVGDFLIPRGAGDFYLEKDSCQDMMFEFTPSALGNRTAVATIRTTIGDFTDTITIHGVGIDPLIEATSEVVDFGVFELGNGKDTTVVLVKNVGSTDITITDTRISGPDMEQFTLNTNPVNYTIPVGQEKEFELNYTAKYGGRTSSILEFHYNGVGSPLRSMLFAEGIGGEVLPQVPDAYVGETVELGIFLGKIKPEGLKEVATKFSATVSYNSTLLAPIDKSMNVTTVGNTSFLKIEGELSGVSQIAAIPMKVGLGTAVKSGLFITEFQLYDADGDSVDYDIEPGVGEFNVLGICEEGGTRLLNPTGEVVLIKLQPNSTATQTTAELTLIEEGQTELSIYDVAGNRLKTLFTGIPKPGTKTIDIDTSEFQSGRYYVRLTTPTITKTEILEVVR